MEGIFSSSFCLAALIVRGDSHFTLDGAGNARVWYTGVLGQLVANSLSRRYRFSKDSLWLLPRFDHCMSIIPLRSKPESSALARSSGSPFEMNLF